MSNYCFSKLSLFCRLSTLASLAHKWDQVSHGLVNRTPEHAWVKVFITTLNLYKKIYLVSYAQAEHYIFVGFKVQLWITINSTSMKK